MLEYSVNPNDNVFIRIQLAKADTGLFPQTKIYAISDPSTVVDTVNLSEVNNGLYGANWTNNGVSQKYFTQTIVYTDSGHLNVHPLIRPDSDSVNVGFNSTGGVFGSRGTSRVKVERLTKEEIKAIAEEVFELVKPELDKKSEFDPTADVVKTNIEIPEIEIPEYPSVYDITKAVVNGLDVENKLKTIKFPEFPEIPSATKITELVVEELEPIVSKIVESNVPDFTDQFKEVKQSIIDNRVEIPEPIDINPSLNEVKKSLIKTNKTVESVAAALLLSQIIEKMGDKRKLTKEQLLKEIRQGADIITIHKWFAHLPAKDRQYIFNILSAENSQILRKLVQVEKAEQAVKIIKNSNNKEKAFNELVRAKKVSQDLIPYIKALNV